LLKETVEIQTPKHPKHSKSRDAMAELLDDAEIAPLEDVTTDSTPIDATAQTAGSTPIDATAQTAGESSTEVMNPENESYAQLEILNLISDDEDGDDVLVVSTYAVPQPLRLLAETPPSTPIDATAQTAAGVARMLKRPAAAGVARMLKRPAAARSEDVLELESDKDTESVDNAGEDVLELEGDNEAESVDNAQADGAMSEHVLDLEGDKDTESVGNAADGAMSEDAALEGDKETESVENADGAMSDAGLEGDKDSESADNAQKLVRDRYTKLLDGIPSFMKPDSFVDGKSYTVTAGCGATIEHLMAKKAWFANRSCATGQAPQNPRYFSHSKHGGPCRSFLVARAQVCACPMSVWVNHK